MSPANHQLQFFLRVKWSREIGLLLLVAYWFFIAYQQSQAQEASQIASGVEYRFGQVMSFLLAGESDTPLTRATLYLRAPDLANTLTAEIPIGSESTIDINYDLDLTQYRLAPFTTVTYWWELENSAGEMIVIPEQNIEYVDNQFQWQRIERDGIVVHWVGDESGIGQIALDAVQDVLPKLQTLIPVEPTKPLQVYVYPSVDDLRSGLRLTGREWVGAHAHPELGVILVASADKQTAEANLKQTIPHELSHLLLYQLSGVPNDVVPRWLDEGLATSIETVPNSHYDTILNEAIESNETIPFVDLCQTFPLDSQSALLAYAQSASLVEYIQEQFGNQAIVEMVSTLTDGADCEMMVSQSLGLSLNELNERWLDHSSAKQPWEIAWQRGGVILVVVVIGLLLIVLFVFSTPQVKSR